jgi:hypothetical protein
VAAVAVVVVVVTVIVIAAAAVGFEVLTGVVMKSSVFWDITPCSPLKVSRRSEEHIGSIFRVEK